MFGSVLQYHRLYTHRHITQSTCSLCSDTNNCGF